MCCTCATGSQGLTGYTRMLEGGTPASGKLWSSRGAGWSRPAYTPTGDRQQVESWEAATPNPVSPAAAPQVPHQGTGVQASKWGFVPGEDDTLELDLRKRGGPCHRYAETAPLL